MLHIICDVIDIAQYYSLKSRMAAMYFALCQNLKSSFLCQFAFENIQNRTKTVLVLLTALNTKNLIKTLML